MSLAMVSFLPSSALTPWASLQTAVITGGSEGMGKAVACQLAEMGANVVIVARTASKLQAAIETMKVSHSSVPVASADVQRSQWL